MSLTKDQLNELIATSLEPRPTTCALMANSKAWRCVEHNSWNHNCLNSAFDFVEDPRPLLLLLHEQFKVVRITFGRGLNIAVGESFAKPDFEVYAPAKPEEVGISICRLFVLARGLAPKEEL